MMNTKIKYPEWMINPYLKCVYCYLANFEGAEIQKDSIVIHTDSQVATANFYDYKKTGILELSVDDTRAGENKFYLHIEPVDPDDTFQAVLSFIDVVKAKSKTINDLEQVITGCKRVLLVCTSGVTSGLFAQMMQKILDENGSSTKVESAALSQLDKICLSCYDKILLTPQVGYHLQDITRHLGKKVAKINTLDFATMNARKVIHDLL